MLLHQDPESEHVGMSLVLTVAWLLGVIAGRTRWLAGELEMDQVISMIADVPIANEADRGARDALRWVTAGAAVAARTDTTSDGLGCPAHQGEPARRPTRLPHREMHAHLQPRGAMAIAA